MASKRVYMAAKSSPVVRSALVGAGIALVMAQITKRSAWIAGNPLALGVGSFGLGLALQKRMPTVAGALGVMGGATVAGDVMIRFAKSQQPAAETKGMLEAGEANYPEIGAFYPETAAFYPEVSAVDDYAEASGFDDLETGAI